METLSVNDSTQMQAYVARPGESPGSVRKGIIVIQEAFGVNDYIRRVADRMASQGFLAIAPELFHRTGAGFEGSYTDYASVAPHMQALTDEGMAADLAAAFDWLKGNGADAEKISAVGFCMGGRAAFLADVTLPLASAVSFYGGRTDALLPKVNDLSGPILFFWGGKDAHIPPEQRRTVLDALDAAGKPYAHAVFSEAGHAFACDARENFHAESAHEAWALADAFLADHAG